VGVPATPQAVFEVELKVAIILRYFNHVTKSRGRLVGRGRGWCGELRRLH
jgi:hypothetical protein